MNLVLAALCAMILLRSSLLRRRTSFAPIIAVASMAGTMALYMSASNMVESLTDLFLLGLCVIVYLIIILLVLAKK